ncbi:malto-oligosyltrehalose synthase [Methyloterricola oryzae]|uniref:malto-oligosyltrehalose synthase n=1 Tax=Methyloterricola oryzae TaxID=1495050 RepID=UPI0005EB4B22|nr:malto-oligosyltrehalose synthase [Methyloterricola oryzae]
MNDEPFPRATYRLQFNHEFTFAHAVRVVPYLHALGISHVYASPCLKARRGSVHGYDIVDHNAFNPEVGGREDFERFVDMLHAHGMGLILDIVPNHMGIAQNQNAWWQDVLENGRASLYSEYFDIDWHPARETLRSKVHLPVLGDHYGRLLEQGELHLTFDGDRGEFAVRYWEQQCPIDPETYPELLARDLESLASLTADENHTMTEWHALIADFEQLRNLRNCPMERSRVAAGCKQRLAGLYDRSPTIQAYMKCQLEEINGRQGEPESFKELHDLLERQSFRLAYWRVASDEINYRRFFDINELVGLRQENPTVFEGTHRLVLALIADGSVNGLRIDHPDGLHDPASYLKHLQQEARRFCANSRTLDQGEKCVYVVAEKILAGYEHLQEDWPVDGTTGYEFSNHVNGLFVYGPSERDLTRTYAHFIGQHVAFDELLYQQKRQVIRTQMSSDLAMLSKRLDSIAQMDLHTRDYTQNSLRDALVEVVARFPVYRTYITQNGAGEDDVRFIDWAVAQAKRRCSASVENTVFDFLRDILLLRNLDGKTAEYRGKVVQFTMRFQQYTAPVMAKSLEDTTFYIYNRLVSLNEVAGDPRHFGVSPAAFHYANQQRLRRWPGSMINTTTHDSKRSEDVRARINVISEIANQWKKQVALWSRLNRRKKQRVEGEWLPSRNDEYLLYQTLLGAWPLEPTDDQGRMLFKQRIEAYMLKAVRESKVKSSWLNPDKTYEVALKIFIDKLLDRDAGKTFLNSFLPFQNQVARWGLFNSLSQTLLKLTSPGAPDIYQGTESWRFLLVDPDNRQLVDFEQLARRMEQLEQCEGRNLTRTLRFFLDNLESGLAKLYLIRKVLEFRRRHPDIFALGEYLPLDPEGERSPHLCAFARRHGDCVIIIIASRWFASLTEEPSELPIGMEVWKTTRLALPDYLGSLRFVEVLSGTHVKSVHQESGVWLQVGHALKHFPVALLQSRLH